MAQMDKVAIIINIIREIEYLSDWGAPEEEIIERAEKVEIPRNKTKSILEMLEQKGEVFEPRSGYYKSVFTFNDGVFNEEC